MRKNLKVAAVLLLVAFGGFSSDAGNINAAARQRSVADEIVAREKASFEAWKRKDKAFYADYWAEDFTEFLPSSPYLDTRANLLPKSQPAAGHGNGSVLTQNQPS